MKKKFLKKILLAIISSTLTLFLAITGTNLYLKFVYYQGKVPTHDWTILYGTYDKRYVFWQSCFSGDSECWKKFKPLDEIVLDSTKITKTGLEQEMCLRILFLGDSYSSKPFSKKSYGDFFLEKFATASNYCVESIYLSSGGVGTSQQLAILEDKIDEIKPDIIFWQFYWNDFLDNIKFSLHDMKDNSLIRKEAWRNSAFWAGYLNQKVPFLIDSTLGFYLSNKLLNADIFKSWTINPFEGEELYDYNEKFISLAIKNVEEMSKKKKFNLFTTISPLECLIVEKYNCEDWTIKQHKKIESILVKNSNYVSMTKHYEDDSEILVDTIDKSLLFSDLDPAYKGIRHLSDKGEEYFGNILFENFKSQILENN